MLTCSEAESYGVNLFRRLHAMNDIYVVKNQQNNNRTEVRK